MSRQRIGRVFQARVADWLSERGWTVGEFQRGVAAADLYVRSPAGDWIIIECKYRRNPKDVRLRSWLTKSGADLVVLGTPHRRVGACMAAFWAEDYGPAIGAADDGIRRIGDIIVGDLETIIAWVERQELK